MKKPTQEEIGALAQLLWEQQGRPQNRATDHWLEAEYRLLSRSLVNDPHHAQDEIDLRSRGLGSLVPPRDRVGQPAGTISARSASPPGASLSYAAIGIGVVVGLGGILASIFALRSAVRYVAKK